MIRKYKFPPNISYKYYSSDQIINLYAKYLEVNAAK